ncbi:MAG: M1 family metallopeptidase [Flavobacteriales bacterium]|nr:M1 family metallopeptidase [Flavobacteriales bacterium]
MVRCFCLIFGILLLGWISGKKVLQAQGYDTRSDSCDILHTEVFLDVLDFTNKTIAATAHIRLTPKVNGLDRVRFDLRNLTVSTVMSGAQPVSFSQVGESVICVFPQSLNLGDTVTLTLQYGGQPIAGTGSFGGFYWVGAFAFNLGVSLNDIPHPFGRAWIPCFDNFVERFTLTCHVRVSEQNAAVCGGTLTAITPHGDGTHTFSWALSEPVPSYLMSVAVGPYVFVEGYFQNNPFPPVPYLLAARPQDTTQMRNSFVNLESALQIFTHKYGPFVWSRVGYVLVPFTSGAMEHACNIAFPQLMANGATTYQTTMAHELAHNWWGNNATCRTAADMWINEGLATYSEALFLENLLGYSAYMDELTSNHKNVLEKAHVEDSTYHPLSPMPERFTYGYHTYLKGSTAMHNLRTYLGDSAFFAGLQAIQNLFHFKDIDAEDFRTTLENATGQNLQNFFEDWMYQPGFLGFEMDSFSVHNQGGSWEVRISITQKLRAAWHYGTQVPLAITLRNSQGQHAEATLLHSGAHQTHVVTGLSFAPEVAVLNAGNQLLHAVTGVQRWLKNTGTQQFPYARLRLTVNQVADSVWWHGAMYWVKPDSLMPWQSGLKLIPSRFWRVDFVPTPSLNADLQVNYDGGNNILSFESGFITSEDSLVILFRPDDRQPWQVWTQVTHQKGSPNDKVGSFIIRQAAPGYYAFGLRNGLVSQDHVENQPLYLWPNPSGECIYFSVPEKLQNREIRLRLTDSLGRIVGQEKMKGQPILQYFVRHLSPGRYYFHLTSGRERWTGSFIRP